MIESPLLRAIAWAPAQLYRLAAAARLWLYRAKLFRTRRLEKTVISVGNLTVGGTGKTPCVAFIAGLLRDSGYRVAILSRGYKRAGSGIIEVSNEERVLEGPVEAGDEPYLLAIECPGVRVVVGADRYAAGRWISERADIDIFILDDGFQHTKLARDLDLLLIDATEPLGEARIVPLGRLREPLSGLARADAIIVTRSNRHFDRRALENSIDSHSRPGTPVFYARHENCGFINLIPDGPHWATRIDGPVAALSGIAKPDLFIDDLSALGLKIVLRRDYPDHHRHNVSEFRKFVDHALDAGASAVVTTQKDAANLPAEALAGLPLPVYAVRIAFHSDDQAALSGLLIRAVESRVQKV